MAEVRNAQAEASEALGDGFGARVLEPSPPSITDEFFADDPVNIDVQVGTVVSPVANADMTWSQIVTERPDLGGFAAERWLANYPRLLTPPETLAETRLALHRVGAYIMSPARRRANTKIALRWTKGGFGTPFFGHDEQHRIEGANLIVQRGDNTATIPLTTLNEVGAAAGIAPDVEWASQQDIPEHGGLDSRLNVDPDASRFVGEWFGFSWSILEELRNDEASVDASRIQLWPEHFDPAFELLSDAEKRRASYGASPGDHSIAEPYIYVSPWHADDQPDNDFWNSGFAALRLSEFVDEPDQRAVALAFLRRGRDLLADA